MKDKDYIEHLEKTNRLLLRASAPDGRKYRLRRWHEIALKWIASFAVIQSHRHQENITKYYRIINDEAREQFREDNKATLDHFLLECFNNSLSPDVSGDTE